MNYYLPTHCLIKQQLDENGVTREFLKTNMNVIILLALYALLEIKKDKKPLMIITSVCDICMCIGDT